MTALARGRWAVRTLCAGPWHCAGFWRRRFYNATRRLPEDSRRKLAAGSV